MEYYISTTNGRVGPYSAPELKARGLRAESLVMAVGSTEWTPAWQVEELRPFIDTVTPMQDTHESVVNGTPVTDAGPKADNAANSGTAGPTFSTATDNQNFQQGRPMTPPPAEPRQKSGGCLKTFLIGLVILLALVAVAVITCPDENAHKSALTNVVSATVSDELNGGDSTVNEDDAVEKFFRQMSDSWSKEVVKAAVDNLIHVDNHIVFSTGKVRLAGKEHTVSVGAFGHVFTVDKDDLRKATDEYYSKAEQSVKQDISKKVGNAIQNDVIDPASKALHEFISGAMNELLQSIGDEVGAPDGSSDEQENDSLPSEGI